MSKFILNTETKTTRTGKLVIEVKAGSAEVGDVFGYHASAIPADPALSPRQRVRAEQAAMAAGHVLEVPKYVCISLGEVFADFEGEPRQYAYVEIA